MKIFVSHSHKDRGALGQLKKDLCVFGMDCFLAHDDIKIGEHDLERIKKEITDCDIFLIIGNKESKQSEFCNQEIGMAIAHNKHIISTVHKDSSPWGFTERQQAIKYKDIQQDLHSKLYNEIIKIPQYKEHYKKEIRYLDTLGIKGFVVDCEKPNHLSLYTDNWNDYGYNTLFNFQIQDKETNNVIDQEINHVKIGHVNQKTGEKTINKLPNYFPCLKQGFFSYVDVNSKISEEEKKGLYFLLNDLRYNTQLAKQYINEEVVEKSLFRDRELQLKELKEKIKQ